MRGKRLFIFGLLAFLVISSLNGLQRRNYRAGYAAGFNTAQQQMDAPPADGDAATTQPVPPAGYAPHHHHISPIGWFFGGLFKLFFFFFLVSIFFKMIGFMFWRRRHDHWGNGRSHWKNGPRPPWHSHDGSPKEKSPEDVEPDIQTH